MLALVRPDSWNLPLFLHVLGATTLVGGVAATVVAAGRSWDSMLLRRVAFRTVVGLVIPAWLLMRVAGQWMDSKENVPGSPTWLGLGYSIGDAGVALLLAAAILGWWSARNPERRRPAQALTAVATLYLIGLLVAMWAMSAKPS